MTALRKPTVYIRFAIGGLYAINFFLEEIRTNFSELDLLSWIGELFIFLVTVTYSAYCFNQGIRELKSANMEAPYLRILAILVEMINVIAFIFLLTQLSKLEWSLLPNMVIVFGMFYLLTQNIRIATGKS